MQREITQLGFVNAVSQFPFSVAVTFNLVMIVTQCVQLVREHTEFCQTRTSAQPLYKRSDPLHSKGLKMSNPNTKPEKCPECGQLAEFIPPNKHDKKRRKLIVQFKCVNGHKFMVELDLK